MSKSVVTLYGPVPWSTVIAGLVPELTPAIACRPRHVPCPIHGGKDGLRCFGDFDKTGGMVCNTCGSFPNGYMTIAWALGVSTRTAARLARKFVQSNKHEIDTSYNSGSHNQYKKTEAQIRENIRAVFKNSIPLACPDAVIATWYLESRGIELDEFPDALRYCESLPYNYGGSVCHPGIIAPIINHGEVVGVHRTYLTPDGHKIIGEAKKVFPVLYPRATSGGAIQLYPPTEELCVAEGIETSLIVHQYLDKPVWAAQSAGAMASMVIPNTVKKLIICADNDVSDAGVEAAKTLATRMYESPRVCRRLHILRGWSHEQTSQIFPGVSGAGGSDAAGPTGRVRFPVGGNELDSGEGRLYS